jgi:hypothetical protein
VNQPRATVRTKTIGNPSFAGAIWFIGHAGDVSPEEIDAEHCEECARLGHTMEHDHHDRHVHEHPLGDVPDEHGARQQRFDVELDVTESLRHLEDEAEEVNLKLVAVDGDGNEIKDEVLLDEIGLVAD